MFLRKNAESIENKRVEFGRVQKSAQESEVYRHSVLKRCAGKRRYGHAIIIRYSDKEASMTERISRYPTPPGEVHEFGQKHC